MPFPYKRNAYSPPTGHAEAKIIEDIFNPAKPGPKPPGKLYLQVSGSTKGERGPKPVCCKCQSLIACAQQAGMEVILCDPSEEESPCK